MTVGPRDRARTPAPASEPRWEVIRRVAAAVCLVLLAGVALLFVRDSVGEPFPWINHDVAFLAWSGSELLDGGRLYVEFDEMNPPGVHFLHAAVLAVGRGLGAGDILATHLFVLALAVAGLAVLWSAMPGRREGLAFSLVSLAYVVVAIRVNFLNNVIPSSPGFPWDFGQREHLFVLVFVPFVMRRLSDRPWTALWVPYLLVVGYVSAFKPYMLALLAVVEIDRLLRRRTLEAGVRVPLAVGAALPQAILGWHAPAGFVAFWGDVVPLMLTGGYATYGLDTATFLVSPLHVDMVATGALFGVLWWAGRSRGLPAVLPVLVVLAYLNVVAQGKFWSYHGVPYFGMIVPFSALAVSRLIPAIPAARLRLGATLLAWTALFGFAATSTRSLVRMLAFYPPKGVELVELIGDREPVMFFAMGADYAYAPLTAGTEVVGPWREHYRIPALLAVEDAAERRSGLDRYAGRIRERIEQARPRLLLFAPYRHGLPTGVHLHDILQEHGAVPDSEYQALEMTPWVRRDPRLAGWFVYRRVDGSTGEGPGG